MMSSETSAAKPTSLFLYLVMIWSLSSTILVSISASSLDKFVGDGYSVPHGNSVASNWDRGPMPNSFRASCLSKCSEAVLRTIYDETALCAMDGLSLSCLDDCFGAGVVGAHCECGTEALFAPNSFEFVGSEAYCCGSSACRAAVATTYTASGASSDAEIAAMLSASCASIWCGSYRSNSLSHEAGSISNGSLVSRPASSLTGPVETPSISVANLSSSDATLPQSSVIFVFVFYSKPWLQFCCDEYFQALGQPFLIKLKRIVMFLICSPLICSNAQSFFVCI